MSALDYQIVTSEIRCYQSIRVQQGQVHVGSEPQQTYLRSCVCVGFYHADQQLGALSHVTGFSQDAGHGAEGALREIERRLGRHGLRLEDCECFVIGGADPARHVYDAVVRELRRRGLSYRDLDVLGAFHRKLLLNPAEGTLKLFKKSSAGDPSETGPAFAASQSLDCFHDRRRRVITGASLFFRNEALLQCLREVVVPSVVQSSDRFHIWCAGCSTGMEVYSLAMVALNALAGCRNPSFELRLLGTDISDEALAQARSGQYGMPHHVRGQYASMFERYCERIDPHTIRVGPELRHRVDFRQRDIREGSHRHRFELVVCDHVLQYFTPEIQIQFLQGLFTGVRPGGFLYASSPFRCIQDGVLADGGYEMLGRSFYRRLSM